MPTTPRAACLACAVTISIANRSSKAARLNGQTAACGEVMPDRHATRQYFAQNDEQDDALDAHLRCAAMKASVDEALSEAETYRRR